MTILDRLADHAKERVEQYERQISFSEMKRAALSLPKGDFAFAKALKKEGLSFICECKKASPSKGVIAERFDYLQIAKDYCDAGADAISVLTEPKWFLGSDGYLEEIASKVDVPCLRKDFVVDEYMLFQAKTLGASAALLICAVLQPQQLKDYVDVCDGLGLCALVEAHDENETELALKVGAKIIGVNNRNLKDFSIDSGNSRRLRAIVPKDVLFVAESGVKTALDVKEVADMGADAVLIGEALMRAQDKKAELAALKKLL